MCWMCDREAFVAKYWAGRSDGLAAHVGAKGFSTMGFYAGDLTMAFPADGVGDLKDAIVDVGVPIGTDVDPDSIAAGGQRTLTVDGPAIDSTLNHAGDQDYFVVTLNAGVSYDISHYGLAAGPTGIPLADPYLELYDAAGNLITGADGGGETPGGQIYGTDAQITFKPTVTGTYYINARAFDNPEDGPDTGDGIGDYQLSVATNTDYVPYYETTTPMHAIDWGTQVNKVHQSVRNPDGQEGPRPTGNPHETPVNEFGITDKNVITYYFAEEGELYVDSNPTTVGTTNTIVAKGFADWEKAVYLEAFAAFSRVADIVYIEVPDAYDPLTMSTDTDFTLVTYTGTPGKGLPSLLGRMSPPDTDNEGQTEFNAGDERWTEAGLQRGGFSFVTLIHELGHGHGLAHPHDNGGESSIMPGVYAYISTPAGPVRDPTGVYPQHTLGDQQLNQGVYTMMSYQDGWQTSPYGQATSHDPYGWLGGLGAFDIAVIQDKYGVNEEYAIGDDTYTLKDVNAPGTFYETIWDAGGEDEIVYDGARNSTIDLRAATLRYEVGGGGWMSYAFGIHGGFTIANGVTIENARTGSGNDILVGNDANNQLEGGLGNDTLDGGLGFDILIGGGGNDTYILAAAGDNIVEAAGGGTDTVMSSVTYTLAAEVENLTLTGTGAINGVGNALNNVMIGNSNANSLTGGAGNDTYYYDHLGDRAYDSSAVDGGVDIVFSSVTATLTTYVENLTLTGTANITGVGNALNNNITGNSGNNVLSGAAGADTMIGGNGNDTFIYDNLGDRGYDASGAGGGVDTVQSSVTATLTTWVENLTLTGTGANTGVGNDLANTITGNSANNQLAGMAGADILSGGGGNDTFVYHNAAHSTAAARDRINGFDLGDKINLAQIDANTNTGANDAFSFIGSAAFSNVAGELRAYQSGADWFVEGDVNGDGVADLVIALSTAGGHVMAVGDFVL